ncbi:MAG: response regulator transcription factor [Alphaproteobacteria bacterium GM7ARS4]|nr:response regulator transcription factor [Alphaproteobacteria bacterium GM7ARS4]
MLKKQTHILVVDDDARLRTLLAHYLSQHGCVVSLASDTQEAEQLCMRILFDIIILDVMMPHEHGTTWASRLRERKERVPILMLTAMAQPQDRIAGLESGVDDYLAKPFEPRELLLRIHAILSRSDGAHASSLWSFGAFTFDEEDGLLRYGAERVRLTSGERALLRQLAQGQGRIITRQQLMERLDMCGSERVIDTQIKRLRQKLHIIGGVDVPLRTHRGKGYSLDVVRCRRTTEHKGS